MENEAISTPSFKSKNISMFKTGMRDGVPIALGYMAVAFSLGIAAQNAGLTPFQSFVTSLLCNASAGEYAGFTMVAARATYLEIAIITLIANARYLLMSFAMSQKLSPDTPSIHRFILSFDLTDELFGISMAQRGYLNPFYTYGAMCVAIPGWSIGTYLGAAAGNILSVGIVSALSVSLFGMFLAIFIPACKKDRVIFGTVCICFLFSYLAAHLPLLSALSEGTRIIILTVAISSAAALLFPRAEETEVRAGE